MKTLTVSRPRSRPTSAQCPRSAHEATPGARPDCPSPDATPERTARAQQRVVPTPPWRCRPASHCGVDPARGFRTSFAINTARALRDPDPAGIGVQMTPELAVRALHPAPHVLERIRSRPEDVAPVASYCYLEPRYADVSVTFEPLGDNFGRRAPLKRLKEVMPGFKRRDLFRLQRRVRYDKYEVISPASIGFAAKTSDRR